MESAYRVRFEVVGDAAERLQTLAFSTEDVLLAVEWAKAEELFEKQRAQILKDYGDEYPPPFFSEIGLEERIGWWEQARETFGLGVTFYAETP